MVIALHFMYVLCRAVHVDTLIHLSPSLLDAPVPLLEQSQDLSLVISRLNHILLKGPRTVTVNEHMDPDAVGLLYMYFR